MKYFSTFTPGLQELVAMEMREKLGEVQFKKISNLGPVSAKKIIRLRKQRRINSLSQLAGQRIQITKFSSFACW